MAGAMGELDDLEALGQLLAEGAGGAEYMGGAGGADSDDGLLSFCLPLSPMGAPLPADSPAVSSLPPLSPAPGLYQFQHQHQLHHHQHEPVQYDHYNPAAERPLKPAPAPAQRAGPASSTSPVDDKLVSLVSKARVYKAASFSRERKSYREKQRRSEVNTKFNRLAACLASNARVERGELLQLAIDTIENLRAENAALKARMGGSADGAQPSVASRKRKAARPPITPYAEAHCAGSACAPILPKLEYSSAPSKPCKQRRTAAASSVDLSSIPGLSALLQSGTDQLLPPAAILAAIVQNQDEFAPANVGRSVSSSSNPDECATHSRCA